MLELRRPRSIDMERMRHIFCSPITLSPQHYQPAHAKTRLRALDSIPQLTGSFQSHTPRPANTPSLWFLEYVQLYLSFSSICLIVLLLAFPSFKVESSMLLSRFIPSYFLGVLVVFGYYTVCFLTHTHTHTHNLYLLASFCSFQCNYW